MTESLSTDVLAALDFLILEQVEEQSFQIRGTIPIWFAKIYPNITCHIDKAWITENLPFLSNFLVDAAEFWQNCQPGLYKSGLWSEKDHLNQDIHLEASALQINHRQILLIKASVTDYVELSSFIQTARNSSLQFIDEQKQAGENILKATFYDNLTGLPNQTYFLIQLAQAFGQHQSTDSFHFAIFIINVDRFQSINDCFGRLAGDQLLIAIAWRLQNCVRDQDIFARLSGDEFVVLLNDIDTVSTALLAANRMTAALKSPLRLSGQELFITASVGISLTLMQCDRAEDLLRDANTAVSYAKGIGRGTYVVFDPTMHERAVRLLKLEHHLKRALQEQELNLFFQPIVCLADQRIIGFEALVRWIHPTLGLVSPLEFIPIAEETGLITAIDHWIVKEACFRIQQWRQFTEEPLSISVNCSPQCFDMPDLVSQIKQLLRQTGILSHHLMLEITESMLFSETKVAIDTLHELQEIGVRLCIDDFGTGYASLKYLQQLPVDTLKIDRSFIKRMDVDNLDLVRSIIELGHDLGMKVMAEGVETPVQRRFLMDMGCQEAQGYLFSYPVDGQVALQLLLDQATNATEN